MSRDSRCENCPALSCENGRSAPVIVESPKFGFHVRSTAAEINWNGEKACLITCRRLSEIDEQK